MSDHSRRGFFKRAMALAAGSVAVSTLTSCASSTSAGNTSKPVAKTAPAPQGKNHTIEIQGFQFSPANLTIKPGDTVTWINRDSAPHTATATDKSWDTGSIAQNGRKSLTMTAGMTASYYCAIHPAMKATVSVA